MTNISNRCVKILIAFLMLGDAVGQAQLPNATTSRTSSNETTEFRFTNLLAQTRPARRTGFSLMPASRNAKVSGTSFSITPMAAGPSLLVLGGGTVGRLTKWAGFTSSNSFIGNSTIFEDKNGNVGVGTDTPTSKLTVAGMIQSLSGGFKFPDGTVQTTAGIAPTLVVRSLNGLMGDLSIQAGTNITVTPAGNTITIASPNTLTSVTTDTTLVGNGTSESPLGITLPLRLSGSCLGCSLVSIQNTSTFFDSIGLFVEGDITGVVATGRLGVSARGISGGVGGVGVRASGGSGTSQGGTAVFADGGNSSSGDGGDGVVANGGGNFMNGNGGDGVVAGGGTASGAGNRGGDGICADAGFGLDGATDGRAGVFFGNVEVTGTLTKGGGSFKIDHPLDPENKYLFHSFVESPDMMNVYNGNITTDENGEAVVKLPDYFEALNRDFRYQLTVIGTFAQAIIAEEVKGNRFKIQTSAPAVKVSWQVTGIRRDAWAEKNRIKVEVEKEVKERGHYLYPELYNQPEERGVEWARNPELMRQLKESRQQAMLKHKRQ